MEFVVVVAVAAVCLFLYYSTRKPPNFPPGPIRLPIIGTLWRSHWNITIPTYERHLRLTRIYGKVMGYFVLGTPSVMVSDVELARELFSKLESCGRPHMEMSRLRTHGKLRGVLLNEGHSWTTQRRFALRHLRDLGLGRSAMEDIIQREVSNLVTRVGSVPAGHPVTVNNFFNVHVANVLWAIVTGKTFTHDDPRVEVIISSLKAFLRSTGDISGILRLAAGAVWKPAGGRLFQSVISSRDRLTELFRGEIKEHRASLDPEAPRDFLDLYLIRSDEEGDGSTEFDEWSLYAMLQDLFLAGSETTSTTLEWGMLTMLLNQREQRRVQAELDSVVGRGNRVELRHRSQLPYTEAVLAETFRCSAVLPLSIPHRATEQIQLAGYTIPKDTWLYMNLYAMHHDGDYWGDPHRFRPDRFIHGGKFVADKHVVPFGIGKRSCMGESLARQEGFLFLANLLHEFDVRLPAGQLAPQLRYEPGLVVGPAAFQVALHRRTADTADRPRREG